jgi:transcriptional regulator with XRE-family HTH domain
VKIMATTTAERGGPDPIDVMVGVKMRSLRQERRMSQSQLGEKLGITFQQVQKYERGTNRVSASMLVKAAKALGVPPATLLPDPTIEKAPVPATALGALANIRGAPEMLDAFSRVDPRLRRELLRLARTLASETHVEDSHTA